jgi:Tfp pilus assembly protein PilO
MTGRILPVFSLIIALAVFFMYVNPMWTGTIAQTNAAIAADDLNIAAVHDYTKKQDDLISARDSIDPAKLASLETFLPSSINNVGLILDLNALAARSGITISNIDVGVPSTQGSMQTDKSQNPIGSVDLTLSAVGTFSAMTGFLQGVEKSARLLDIRDLVVNGSDTGVYDYQMTLKLYWLR